VRKENGIFHMTLNDPVVSFSEEVTKVSQFLGSPNTLTEICIILAGVKAFRGVQNCDEI